HPRRWLASCADALAVTPLIVAETDYLVAALGAWVPSAFRRELAHGAVAVEWWASAIEESVEIAERYRDLSVSLADASLVALAARLGTTVVGTFDECHFRALRPLRGAPHFTLVPADAI